VRKEQVRGCCVSDEPGAYANFSEVEGISSAGNGRYSSGVLRAGRVVQRLTVFQAADKYQRAKAGFGKDMAAAEAV